MKFSEFLPFGPIVVSIDSERDEIQRSSFSTRENNARSTMRDDFVSIWCNSESSTGSTNSGENQPIRFPSKLLKFDAIVIVDFGEQREVVWFSQISALCRWFVSRFQMFVLDDRKEFD